MVYYIRDKRGRMCGDFVETAIIYGETERTVLPDKRDGDG